VARVFGGLLYLAGGIVMAYNLARTIRGDIREAPKGAEPATVPAE
jgi:cytochrome c oxidase cbb3-type subunit 1